MKVYLKIDGFKDITGLNRQEITFIHFINYLISDKLVVSLDDNRKAKGKSILWWQTLCFER